MLPFLMKEFPGGGNTVQEQFFGWRLSSARMVIECVFGRLKVRLGALKRRMDINSADLPCVIYARFVLHNVCELQNEKVTEDDMARAIAYDREFQAQMLGNRYSLGNCEEASGKEVRNISITTKENVNVYIRHIFECFFTTQALHCMILFWK